MKIHKALNNNAAVVLDEKGHEKIVMGKGICFKKKAGDEIPEELAGLHVTFDTKIIRRIPRFIGMFALFGG